MSQSNEQDPEPGRVRHSVHVRRDILERARDTAAALAGHPAYMTLGAFLDAALERECERLEKKHNAGKRFPPRPSALRGGRRSS